MERIPCIKCDSKLWEYIKPYLKEWGYIFGCVGIFEEFPLLVINYNDNLGICTNTTIHGWATVENNRIFTDNVEEFLERAAKLKGFTYKRKDMKEFTKDNLKSGMVVITRNKMEALVVNDLLLFHSGFEPLSNYTDDLVISEEGCEEYDIVKVYAQSNTWAGGTNKSFPREELLWEREEVKEYTMQEIADKLGIPVEQLRIRK